MAPCIETEHLLLRPFRPQDALRLYRNHSEPSVKAWIPNENYADLAEAQDAISFFADCVSKVQLPYVLAIELKATGELIGDTGLNEVEDKPSDVEVGYTICQAHCCKGYAAEALRALTNIAVSTFGIKTLYGRGLLIYQKAL